MANKFYYQTQLNCFEDYHKSLYKVKILRQFSNAFFLGILTQKTLIKKLRNSYMKMEGMYFKNILKRAYAA